MNYNLIKDVIDLVEDFESQSNQSAQDVDSFKKWIISSFQNDATIEEPEWEGKENGRSPESVINTFIVHMNRYARSYSRSAIHDSGFATQDDFIYLINLKTFGPMNKMELIKKNVQDKSGGTQIINRLIKQGFVDQKDSEVDKRSKIIHISKKGMLTLEEHMDKIRQATQIVTGDLTHQEKMELIRLLTKLNDFHLPIYNENLEPAELLNVTMERFNHN